MESTLQGHYAGFVSRLLAFVVDIVILTISLTLIAWFITTINSLFGLDNLFGAIPSLATISSIIEAALTGLVGILYAIGYALFFWVLTGQTPGKMLMGIRVVTLDGGHLSFMRAVRRLVGFVLAALPLYVGFLWILIDDRRQGWHDKVAGTCVVYSWAARPDETFLKDKS